MILVYEFVRLVNRMIKEGILAVLTMICSVSVVTSLLEAKVKVTSGIVVQFTEQYKIGIILVMAVMVLTIRLMVIKGRDLFLKKYFAVMPVVDLLVMLLVWNSVLSQVEIFYRLDNNQSNIIILSVVIVTLIYFYVEHLVFKKIVKQPMEWKNSERNIKIDEIANVTYLNVPRPVMIGEDISQLPGDYFKKYTIKTTYRTKWLGMLLSEYVHERKDTFDLLDDTID